MNMSHILLPPGKYGIWLIFLLLADLNLENLYTAKIIARQSTTKCCVDFIAICTKVLLFHGMRPETVISSQGCAEVRILEVVVDLCCSS